MKAITIQGLQQYERNRKEKDLRRQLTVGLARKLEKKRSADRENIVINLTFAASNSNMK